MDNRKAIDAWFKDEKAYWRWLISGLCLVSGMFLLFEHYWTKHHFDLELLGHETYGLLLILAGYIILLRR